MNEGSNPSGHATPEQLINRLRAQIQFKHFNESQIALAEEVIAVLGKTRPEYFAMVDLIEKHQMQIVYRKVHADWMVWSGAASGNSSNLREAIEECARNVR